MQSVFFLENIDSSRGVQGALKFGLKRQHCPLETRIGNFNLWYSIPKPVCIHLHISFLQLKRKTIADRTPGTLSYKCQGWCFRSKGVLLHLPAIYTYIYSFQAQGKYSAVRQTTVDPRLLPEDRQEPCQRSTYRVIYVSVVVTLSRKCLERYL